MSESKLLVISGGTKGIGRAIIEKFSKDKLKIITCSRSASDLEALKKAVNGQNKIETFQADLSEKKEVKAFADYVLSFNQPIEMLINNSGIFIPGEIHSEEEGNMEKMIETNLYSAYYLTRGLIKNMIQNQGGHIFNIASVASLKGYPNGGSYSISKFAMYGLSQNLREELKDKNIKVTAVMPGATFTSSWEGVDIPRERFMKAEDVAEIVYSTYHLSKSTVVEDIILRPQLGDL
ncbi:MAG TPA: SDR family oxidoreductase [Cyclobacteriaceae bacterium]